MSSFKQKMEAGLRGAGAWGSRVNRGCQRPHTSNIVMQGDLRKYKGNKSRHFVLYSCSAGPGSPAVLECWDSLQRFNNGSDPHNSYPINQSTTVQDTSDEAESKRQWNFTVSHHNELLHLVAATSAQLTMWVTRLQQTIDTTEMVHTWEVEGLDRALLSQTVFVGRCELHLGRRMIKIVNPKLTIDLLLTTIRTVGCQQDYVVFNMGRYSTVGAGNVFFATHDHNIANNIVTVVVKGMTDLAQAMAGTSTGTPSGEVPNKYRIRSDSLPSRKLARAIEKGEICTTRLPPPPQPSPLAQHPPLPQPLPHPSNLPNQGQNYLDMTSLQQPCPIHGHLPHQEFCPSHIPHLDTHADPHDTHMWDTTDSRSSNPSPGYLKCGGQQQSNHNSLLNNSSINGSNSSLMSRSIHSYHSTPQNNSLANNSPSEPFPHRNTPLSHGYPSPYMDMTVSSVSYPDAYVDMGSPMVPPATSAYMEMSSASVPIPPSSYTMQDDVSGSVGSSGCPGTPCSERPLDGRGSGPDLNMDLDPVGTGVSLRHNSVGSRPDISRVRNASTEPHVARSCPDPSYLLQHFTSDREGFHTLDFTGKYKSHDHIADERKGLSFEKIKNTFSKQRSTAKQKSKRVPSLSDSHAMGSSPYINYHSGCDEYMSSFIPSPRSNHSIASSNSDVPLSAYLPMRPAGSHSFSSNCSGEYVEMPGPSGSGGGSGSGSQDASEYFPMSPPNQPLSHPIDGNGKRVSKRVSEGSPSNADGYIAMSIDPSFSSSHDVSGSVDSNCSGSLKMPRQRKISFGNSANRAHLSAMEMRSPQEDMEEEPSFAAHQEASAQKADSKKKSTRARMGRDSEKRKKSDSTESVSESIKSKGSNSLAALNNSISSMLYRKHSQSSSRQQAVSPSGSPQPKTSRNSSSPNRPSSRHIRKNSHNSASLQPNQDQLHGSSPSSNEIVGFHAFTEGREGKVVVYNMPSPSANIVGFTQWENPIFIDKKGPEYGPDSPRVSILRPQPSRSVPCPSINTQMAANRLSISDNYTDMSRSSQFSEFSSRNSSRDDESCYVNLSSETLDTPVCPPSCTPCPCMLPGPISRQGSELSRVSESSAEDIKAADGRSGSVRSSSELSNYVNMSPVAPSPAVFLRDIGKALAKQDGRRHSSIASSSDYLHMDVGQLDNVASRPPLPPSALEPVSGDSFPVSARPSDTSLPLHALTIQEHELSSNYHSPSQPSQHLSTNPSSQYLSTNPPSQYLSTNQPSQYLPTSQSSQCSHQDSQSLDPFRYRNRSAPEQLEPSRTCHHPNGLSTCHEASESTKALSACSSPISTSPPTSPSLHCSSKSSLSEGALSSASSTCTVINVGLQNRPYGSSGSSISATSELSSTVVTNAATVCSMSGVPSGSGGVAKTSSAASQFCSGAAKALRSSLTLEDSLCCSAAQLAPSCSTCSN